MAYGYVSGNPLAWVDWLGLSSCEVPKMSPEQRQQFLSQNNVSTNDIIGFQEYVGDLLEVPEGIEQVRISAPAYSDMSDMGIIIQETFGTNYINPNADNILGMAQYDGQSNALKSIAETAISSIPTPVSALNKIDVLQSVINFVSGTGEIIGEGDMTNEQLLDFYGSQVGD